MEIFFLKCILGNVSELYVIIWNNITNYLGIKKNIIYYNLYINKMGIENIMYIFEIILRYFKQ